MSRLVATGEWTFSFDEETGWDNDLFRSPAEALEAARKAAPEYADEEGMEADEKAHFLVNGNVYIGQRYVFEPSVDVDFVIENIQEEAYEEGGEFVGDYLDPPPMKDAEAHKKWNEQVADLEKRLTDVFRAWAKETKNEPNFWLVYDVVTKLLQNETEVQPND
jgi:hypothetical protein